MGYALGLGGGYHHDASACLVADGAVVAYAEEERFTRRKHNADSRSCSHAVAYCLAEAGIDLGAVDEIGVGWNHRWPEPLEAVTDRAVIAELLDPGVTGRVPTSCTVVPHHLAHAASAFYCSGFDEAAILVVDGSGDGVSTSIGRGSSATGIELGRQLPYTQSLGWFYESAAEHIGLGAWTSAGKLMGLAAYGEPRFSLPFVHECDDGYAIDLGALGVDRPDGGAGYANLDFYRSLKEGFRRAFTAAGVDAQRPRRAFDAATGSFARTTTFTAAHRDLAASVQQKLERCLVGLAREALGSARATDLCIAGGVGLNCSANAVIRRESGASRLFVQPASGDAGLAIGVALELARRRGELALPMPPMRSAALGPAFDDDAVGRALVACGIDATWHGEALPAAVAPAIGGGATVGWFQGRMEAGPRALGQRSILGDPTSVAVRDRINGTIKRREMWRPLAPSLLEDEAPRLLGDDEGGDFMIVATTATPEAAAVIPGTVHVDGSLRPQVVRPSGGGPYAELLEAVRREIGVAAVLNTSFNHEAEPVVCTPIDAIRTFWSTPLDVLAIGGWMVTKGGAP